MSRCLSRRPVPTWTRPQGGRVHYTQAAAMHDRARSKARWITIIIYFAAAELAAAHGELFWLCCRSVQLLLTRSCERWTGRGEVCPSRRLVGLCRSTAEPRATLSPVKPNAQRKTQLNSTVEFSSVSCCALNRRRAAMIRDEIGGRRRFFTWVGQSVRRLSLDENCPSNFMSIW